MDQRLDAAERELGELQAVLHTSLAVRLPDMPAAQRLQPVRWWARACVREETLLRTLCCNTTLRDVQKLEATTERLGQQTKAVLQTIGEG